MKGLIIERETASENRLPSKPSVAIKRLSSDAMGATGRWENDKALGLWGIYWGLLLTRWIAPHGFGSLLSAYPVWFVEWAGKSSLFTNRHRINIVAFCIRNGDATTRAARYLPGV